MSGPPPEAADDPAVAHLFADPGDLAFDYRGCRPRAIGARIVPSRTGQDLLAVWGVRHLGVKLDAVDPRRSTSSTAATGEALEDASAVKPAGASNTVSR